MKHFYPVKIFLSCFLLVCLVLGNLKVNAGNLSHVLTRPGSAIDYSYYRDLDGDGYGDANNSISSPDPTPPVGYVADGNDCNDNDFDIHPGATEYCNGVDDDCNGTIDDNAFDALIYYADSDEDGFGDPDTYLFGCSQPPGYVLDNSDCDDTRPDINIYGTEVCNGLDDDCNGEVDDNAADALTWYFDNDVDGYGDAYAYYFACEQPEGYVSDFTDCDDYDTSVNPGAAEICNGVDDNCDGFTDEGLEDYWYADTDNDGYGDDANSIYGCQSPGYVADNTDCDDSDPNINPGGIEICNGLDDDCNFVVDDNPIDILTWYADADGDGYGDANTYEGACTKPVGYVSNSTDCNDANKFIHPGATEICNGIDDDCNGSIDDGADSRWYVDLDHDGYGNPIGYILSCTPVPSRVNNGLDCNDTDPLTNPDAWEICNGVDDNCNGTIDDNPLDGYDLYVDADEDGYGNPLLPVFACWEPGYSFDNTDCNDNDATINPGQIDICNGVDDNCNGLIDEDVAVVATAINDGPGCAGSTINLVAADGGGNYTWTGPNGFEAYDQYASIPNSTPADAGTYTVDIESIYGCITSATTDVVVNICNDTLKLKVFIEGYYRGSRLMTPVLYNQLITGNNTIADSITVSLIDSTTWFDSGRNIGLSTVASTTSVLHTDGKLTALIPNYLSGNKYYIRLTHRNAAETWSGKPILFTNERFYDFTTNADSAYGGNQKDVFGEGIWSILSGDVDHTGGIDGSDFLFINPFILAGAGGYNSSDLNGSGGVDGSDFLMINPNILAGRGISRP